MYWYFKYCTIYFNWFEQVLKLQYNIALALSDFSTKDWWTAVLLYDESSFERLQELFETKEVVAYEDYILMVQRTYMGLKNEFEDFRLQLEREESVILSLIPKDSGLYKFLKGKAKSRYTTEDYHLFRYFDLWLYLKRFIFGNLDKPLLKEYKTTGNYARIGFDILRKHGGSHDNFIYNMFLLLIDIQSIHKRTKGLNQERWITIPLDDRIFDEVRSSSEKLSLLCSGDKRLGFVERSIYKKIIPYVIKLYEFVREMRQENALNFVRQLAMLFAYLNTGLLGIDAMKVINVIKECPFAATIQNAYWAFSARHPGKMINYVFADIEVHNIVNSEDFLWGESRSPSCFNIRLSWPKVQRLYEFLIESHYISKDTDARNFCYALTGFKPATTWEIKQVNWVHQEKQSLALFIGELLKRDQRSLKWNDIPKVFLHNGKDVSFHSSTQYNQALKSGKYESLLDAIEQAEKYHPNINKMLDDKGNT